ncbi:hypothetical protein [Stackebrandtia soli]|uniref:hypothetical protein n=1 Tax=Stackebrandtia soli TaxID=1892856 RepID=UPI0039E86CED
MVPPASWLRRLAAAFSWLAVTTVAAIGSWLGMSAVFAGQPHPARTDVLVADTAESSPPPTNPEPEPTSSPPPTTTTHQAPAPESPSPSSSSPESSPTTEPPPDGVDKWYQVDEETYEGTFGTEGGTTTVQVRPTEAVFVSASPADGYTVDVEQVSEDELVIYFYKADVVVTVEVWWSDGPTAQITTMS